MKTRITALSLTLVLAACSQSSEHQASTTNELATNAAAQEPLAPAVDANNIVVANDAGLQTSKGAPAASVQKPLTPPAPGTPGGLRDDRSSPAREPKGQIEPKSSEAAGQVVQQFGALIEQKRFAEARKLWSNPAAADRLRSLLSGYSEAHLEIGSPGRPEGAAGSVYVTVPVVLYGRRKSGPEASTPANVILRRVNEVDGSTQAQRRWHIERIDLKSPD